jgi:predicted ATPase
VNVIDDTGPGPLRASAGEGSGSAGAACRTRSLALARSGSPDLALPALLDVLASGRTDEVLAALLLAEAVPPSARQPRWNATRRTAATWPSGWGRPSGTSLQRTHARLLAADSPTRHGIRYDADALVGRDDDLGTLLAPVPAPRRDDPRPGRPARRAWRARRPAHRCPPARRRARRRARREDVVGEVGSTSVRESVSSVSALTSAQRSDVRGRMAAMLDRSPTLLVLDNCEHVIDEVAELVAFLVAATRDLRVLTTSRRPLAISAEQVLPLAQLDLADAARLFELRATAARPGVLLDHAQVARLVSRLDGLPLAIELAAAKTRVMSVSEIDRRLGNRFELLRDGDRAAPDRHQTLLAVIDWSWTLLEPEQRRALRRLSVFSDGFKLDTAEAVIGERGVQDVAALVDQSLLTVVESGDGVRYRMLETVREFGLMHLVDTGGTSGRAAPVGDVLRRAQRHGAVLRRAARGGPAAARGEVNSRRAACLLAAGDADPW